MQKYAVNDHYLDPETGVLKNKLGVQAPAILEQREADYATARAYELAKAPIEGRFDLDHLRAIHKHLFWDVYAWAGELRDIDLAKGNSYFASHMHIASAARPVFAKLSDEGYLTGLDKEPCRSGNSFTVARQSNVGRKETRPTYLACVRPSTITRFLPMPKRQYEYSVLGGCVAV